MKTEDIDLTKCVNLRYMARIGEHHVVGRIGFDENGTIVLLHNGLEPWRGSSLEEIMKIYGMENFEIIPRDPETYRDWQVGDVIGSIDEYGKIDDVVDNQCRVIFRSGELVAIADNYSAEEAEARGCYTCSQLFRLGLRLVLTDIENQIIEGKRKQEYEPQDGDICYMEGKTDYQTIFISAPGSITSYYVSYGGPGGEMHLSIKKLAVEYSVMDDKSVKILRPSTEDEKQKLFDAMAKQGKRWNAEKKVVEDIPKPHEFKKGEPVLVRDYEFHRWIIAAYVDKDKLGFIANAGVSVIHWKYCIPYNERTMHLLGTTEDYKEGE